jgi:ATP-dependent protease ClpP protease subunit
VLDKTPKGLSRPLKADKSKAGTAKRARRTVRPKSIMSVSRGFPLTGRGCIQPVAASAAQRKKRRAARGNLTAGRYEIMAAGDKQAEILLYGVIGDSFWDDTYSAEKFAETLQDLGPLDLIKLRINSGGGNVFDATAIYNTLVKNEAEIRVEIEGVAASAATLVAMAGDEIRMSENAYFMIHNASGAVWGTADDMRKYINLLEMVNKSIQATYAARTNIDIADLADMMDEETWFTAEEAMESGFIDAVDEAKAVEPHITPENYSGNFPHAELNAGDFERVQSQINTLAAVACPPNQPDASLATQDAVVLQDNNDTETEMNKKLRERCVTAGMDPKLTDEQAQAWLADNLEKLTASSTATATTDPPPAAGKDDDEDLSVVIAKVLDARDAARAKQRQAFRKEVDACLELVFDEEVPEDLQRECHAMDDIGDVRKHIQAAKKAKDSPDIRGARISMATTQPRDLHHSDVSTAFVMRCLQNSRVPEAVVDRVIPKDQRGKHYEDFMDIRLSDMARECLIIDGFRDVHRYSAMDVAIAAMGWPEKTGLANVRAEGAAYHTTGSLSYITQDAFNKSLLAGYMENPSTWRGPGRQASSVPDFKQIHRIRLSNAPNLPVWNDNDNPSVAALANEEGKYAVEAYAEEISYSWRLMVNDDMDALSRTPAILGRAAARTVNAHFWSEITTNGTMSDAVALFSAATGNRKRANLITGSATPTTATIGAMRKLMRLMRGVNTPENNEGDDVLNIQPRFIVGPAALEQTIMTLVNSSADPADNKSSAVYNTARTLVPVIEPLLDANSATAWYLFADPNDVDTVEVTFLQGQETPFTNTWRNERSLSQMFTVVQTFAARRIDHRGMVKHAGA